MSYTEATADPRDPGDPDPANRSDPTNQTDPSGATSPPQPPAHAAEPAGTLHRFIETADAIRASSSKLEKTRLLAGFFRSLANGDLYWAAVYFTGAGFPRGSGKVLQVGFAALQAAALAVTGADPARFHEAYLRWSDVGDAMAEIWPDHRPPTTDHRRQSNDEGRRTHDGNPATGDGATNDGSSSVVRGPSLISTPNTSLSLSDLAVRFEHLAATPAGGAKTAAVTELFREFDRDQARYVAKILTGDLRIGLKEGLVEDAIAAAFEAKPAEVRKAHQLAGDIGKVAAAARAGTLANLEVVLFTPVKPMLATAEASPEAIAQRVGAELWIEDKFDGIRAQAHRSEERVAIFSRDLKEVSAQFPEVVAALRGLPGTLILDGEILAHREGIARPFFDLQRRLGRKELSDSVLASFPVGFFAFDLLYQDGEPLLDHPFRERRARLEALPQPPGFYLSPLRRRPVEELNAEFALAKSRANEGLMVKDPESRYLPGRRGMGWLKYKRALEPLDVVVTGVEYGHGRRREVLSDYTFAVRDDETGGLVNVGKAYTGLTDAEILELTEYFKQNTVRDFGRYRQVKPELVIEVAFEAIQQSPRHKSGFALRFPRILRLRPDKPPADVNTLADVRRSYEQYRSVYDGSAPESETADERR